jgi:hypothetical protein
MVVESTTVGLVPGIPPKVTVAGLWKSDPFIVTVMPPATGPEVGVKFNKVGVGKV